MKKQCAIACSVMACSMVFSARAENHGQSMTDNITLDASVGWLAGKSQENVYDIDDGSKISQLDWKIKNTPIIKLGFAWEPTRRLTLNARGWTTLASRSAKMDDHDWIDSSQSRWSDWSTHPNSRLNHANEFDLGITGWVLNQPRYRLGGVIGYQQTRFSWTAIGGSYQYDNGTQVGTFPQGEHVSGYRQRFSLPYLGVAGLYRYQQIEFNLLLKFSPWIQARDNDEHYLRELTFRDNADDVRYYSASLDVGYYLTPHAKVFTALSWSKYQEGKGGTQVIDTQSGESESESGDVAGISNKNYNVTFGLQYQF